MSSSSVNVRECGHWILAIRFIVNIVFMIKVNNNNIGLFWNAIIYVFFKLW